MSPKTNFYPGSQFIFLNPDQKEGIKVKINQKEQTFKQPSIISRYKQDIDVIKDFKDSWSYNAIQTPLLNLITVITDKKVYKPKETIKLIIIAPQYADQEVKSELSWNSVQIEKSNLTLNKGGLLLKEITGLDEGSYENKISIGEATASTSFTVAEHTLSFLQAKLTSYQLEGQEMSYQLEINFLGAKYNGMITVGLLCQFCNNAEVSTQELVIKDGEGSGKFSLAGHTGPFNMRISNKQGDTATLFIPGSRSTEREKILVNPLGKVYTASLMPSKDSDKIRGIYYEYSDVANPPLVLEEMVATEGRLQALEPLSLVMLEVISPNGENQKYLFKDVQKKQVLSFPLSDPYSTFFVGAFAKDPYEAFGVVIKPEELSLQIDVQEKAQPSEKITAKLEAKKDGYCLLMVCDARLEQENPIPKLGEKIYSHLKNSFSQAHHGKVERFQSHIYRLRGLPFEEVAIPTSMPSTAPMRPSPARSQALPMDFAMPVMAKMSADTASFGVGAGTAFAVSPAPEQEPAPALALLTQTTARQDFPQMIFCDLFPVEAGIEKEITFQLGDQIGNWRCQAFLFSGLDYVESEKYITSSKDLFLELDVPALISKGDMIMGKVHYSTKDKAQLEIITATTQTKKEVQGEGDEVIELTSAGEVVASLSSNGNKDVVSKTIGFVGREKITCSSLRFLKKGDVVSGTKVVVYPSFASLTKESVKALVQYPFGCAEQTSSKIYGLCVVYRGMKDKVITGNGDFSSEEVQRMINAGIERMKLFYNNGMFTLWERGLQEMRTTQNVLKNLVPAYQLDFAPVKGMVNGCKEQLIKSKVKNNRLLALDPRFQDKINSVEDASATYLYGKNKEESFRYIKEKAVEESEIVYWKAKEAWGGDLEVTCDALRVLYDKGDSLFEKGFKYISGKIINGMLYSTADTRALVDLFASLKAPSAGSVKLDGEIISLQNEVVIGKEVEALTDSLIVRIDEEKEIDYLDVSSNFAGKVKLSAFKCDLGQKLTLNIRPEEQTLCPLTRVFLPGCLGIIEGGAIVQKAYLPIKQNELNLELIAVKQGKGKLFVTMHDMYDSEKVGVMPALEIKVS